MNAFSLKDKTIFITGASSGLGAQTAISCSEAGANVIITGRNEARLIETYEKLSGTSNIKMVADVTKEEDISQIVKELPVLDGVVLCAGITETQLVKRVKNESISNIFQTNFFSSVELIRGLLKGKKIAKGGSIVFISSISSSYADIGNSIYAASKGAINSFSRVLALELAGQNITSNCIQPGFIPSRFLDAGIITDDQLEEERKRYPLGFGEPKDIANGVIYLLSDASKWMTGTTITIDGGVTLR